MAWISGSFVGALVMDFLPLIVTLIFPGVIFTDENNIAVGIAGGPAAAILAWRKCAVMTCVLAAIAVDFIVYLIIL